MFLQAAIASSRLTFSSCVRVTMALRFFTVAFARPLDLGYVQLQAHAELSLFCKTLQILA